MANSTEEGYDLIDLTQYLIPFGCFVTFSLAGLLIQSFIVVVNVIDWMKGRSITGADQIITSIGISRIFLHTTYLMYIVLLFYFSRLPKLINILNDLTARTSAFADIWLSTLLSIFFYFKISTFHNILFLRLKAFISRRVVHLIIASVLMSVVYSSMYYVAVSMTYSTISTQNATLSYRQEEIISHVYTVWTVLPLLMTFVASLLLIILLGFHLRRMKIRGNVTSSTDAYLRTMKYTVVSFLGWAFYMLGNVSPINMGFLFSLWWFVLMTIFPVLHSVLLIYVSTKLRNHFLRIVRCGTICLRRNRNPPGPRSGESVEVTRL
ncbi:PREDICTED: taste receptor type 2 member 125-like [Nanorana parkeri]|uniref:taste receptor type 2 member 125-like n=1 Tax=Nanorana parkeri TaxID=125878 RepID=UPI000854A0CD|nr:PREDICTED: taste receptor type 2 member 125-like [Nanorana parkeri]